MYDAVLEQASLDPRETLFVGDTWSCDVEGPRSIGLEPVYVRRLHLGPDKTAPDGHETQDVHQSTDLRILRDLTG